MKNIKSVTSHALGPLSLCHKLSLLLRPPPLERDVLYERPLLTRLAGIVFLMSRLSIFSLYTSITVLLTNYQLRALYYLWAVSMS